jgi:putative transposase
MQGTSMERSKLQALAAELAKDIKTEADLNALSRELLKLTVETALSAELTEHLGYEKHGDSKLAKGNARNGATPKRLKSQHGEVEILSPRDRDGSFEPQLLRKHQTRLTQMDDQILTLYAKGLITREIVEAFKEMYDANSELETGAESIYDRTWRSAARSPITAPPVFTQNNLQALERAPFSLKHLCGFVTV